MGIEENKKTMLTFLEEVIHNKKTEMIYELATPNHVSHNAGGGYQEGIDNYKSSIEMVSKAFPDIHYVVEKMISEGDTVCTCLKATATHQNEFMGIAPTGKKCSWGEVAISRFEDGKIVEEWQYVTRPGLLEQIGISPSK